MRQHVELALSPVERTLPERLAGLLARLPEDRDEVAFALPNLALALGRRLPQQAQTITFWQRGELGRSLRRAGYSVRVELDRVIFVRRTPQARTQDQRRTQD